MSLKTGAGRPTAAPRKIRDAESIPCPRGGLHELANSAARGGLVTACHKCSASWSEIDAAERGRA
jgi:hypothetical protein